MGAVASGELDARKDNRGALYLRGSILKRLHPLSGVVVRDRDGIDAGVSDGCDPALPVRVVLPVLKVVRR